MQGWELLKRLLSESAREGGEEGGVETPDTSLVRRNQLEKRGKGETSTNKATTGGRCGDP